MKVIQRRCTNTKHLKKEKVADNCEIQLVCKTKFPHKALASFTSLRTLPRLPRNSESIQVSKEHFKDMLVESFPFKTQKYLQIRGFINLVQPAASLTWAMASSCHLSCDPNPRNPSNPGPGFAALWLDCRKRTKVMPSHRLPRPRAEDKAGRPTSPCSRFRACGASSFLYTSVPSNGHSDNPNVKVTLKQATNITQRRSQHLNQNVSVQET